MIMNLSIAVHFSIFVFLKL